ncbi:hypothetical protein B0H19DRAFT_1275534 [Mycena capillaripes]|nr:hypothetical protein B0H19DRAFT_1275534 [Mycena capillaripes]
MFIALKFFTLVSLTLAAIAVPIAPAKPDVGNMFAVYPGWDMNNGGGLQQISGITEMSCLQMCSANGGCVGYAYAPYGIPGSLGTPLCVIKNSITLSSFVVESDRITNVALVGACGTFSPVGPSICHTVSL